MGRVVLGALPSLAPREHLTTRLLLRSPACGSQHGWRLAPGRWAGHAMPDLPSFATVRAGVFLARCPRRSRRNTIWGPSGAHFGVPGGPRGPPGAPAGPSPKEGAEGKTFAAILARLGALVGFHLGVILGSILGPFSGSIFEPLFGPLRAPSGADLGSILGAIFGPEMVQKRTPKRVPPGCRFGSKFGPRRGPGHLKNVKNYWSS